MSDTVEHAETPSGTVVAGRYEIERLIARGGMAAVYLARQLQLNRKVAIKILTPPTAEEDALLFEERFRLEAETLAGLSHPNIVVLHDYGELDDGRVFLAMEYIDGPRLTDVLKDGPLSWERALTLIGQVVLALRYAHKQGVVHRDLKPSNLLITRDMDGMEIVKVVDFGLVKLTEGDQSITRAGLILGSPHCMSPEQVKGNDIDHRSDLYAIGVLLFRCVTGAYPFHGANSTATMIEHLNTEAPTFFSVSSELRVPDGFEEIVRRCLRKDPGERPHDASELLHALKALMVHAPESFTTTSHSTSPFQAQGFPTPITLSPVQRPAPSQPSLMPALIGLFLLGLFLLTAAVIMLAVVFTQGPASVPREVPQAIPTPLPLPEPEVRPEPAPEPEPEPVVAPAPAPVVKPAPSRPRPVRPRPSKPRPAPVKPAPTPGPAPAPAPEPVPEPKQPPGYMGLPEF